MIHGAQRRAIQGFSLVEVMVAVVVICVGLLGIAKMQALAVSSTTTARLRSMAAFQGASLASILHSNRAYWASAAAVANGVVTITVPAGATVAQIGITPAGFAQTFNFCIRTTVSTVPACTPQQLAGFDVQRWAQAMIGLMPTLTTTITCQGAIQPQSCIIQMSWTEQTGRINATETSVAIVDPAINATPANNLDYYTLYVEP